MPVRSITRLTSTLCALALFASPLQAQLVDQQLNPGDSFTAEIDSADDVDVVEFDSVAGAGLKITVGPVAKSGLLLHVELIDTSDDTVVAEGTATKKKLSLTIDNADKGEGLPSTGTYQIRVSGAEGTTGGFTLRFTEKLSKANRKLDETVEAAADADVSVGFAAAAGMEAAITVQRADKQSAADPTEPEVVDPGDVAIDLSDASVKASKNGDKFNLKGVALDSTGDWSIDTTNEGEQGALRIKASLKRAKTKKRKLGELTLGDTETTSLSGTVLASNDKLGLGSVVIQVFAAPDLPLAPSLVGAPLVELGDTVTDVNGNFVVSGLPPGPVEVRIDGTTATGKPVGSTFGVLLVMAEVAPEGGSELPQALVLPDLNNPKAAKQTVAVNVLGQTSEVIDATSGTGAPIQIAGPIGTTILIGGVPASAAVAINVTPVSPSEVPMPLLDAEGNPLDAASYVTVQPPNAQFDTSVPGLTEGVLSGLDIVLPNDRGFPPGTLVDIWSFDHDAGAWVNRTAQTGQQGEVSLDGTRIEAEKVIVKGGWHAPVLPVDPDCGTKLVGRLIDSVTLAPVPGATVATDIGQFATTDANGDFELVSVPAYELPSFPCVPIDVTVNVITSVNYGHAQTSVVVSAGTLLPGDCTDIGDIPIVIPAKGSLVGKLTKNGVPVAGGTVQIAGASSFTLTSDAKGQFFATCVAKGSYTASHTFAGDASATVVAFGIQANKLTAINLQKSSGTGTKDITICVVKTGSSTLASFPPVAGAQVLLVGSDPASAAGVLGTTNTSGKVTFLKVTPPYTITAQADRPVFEGGELLLARLATSVIGITPKTASITVFIEADFDTGGNDLFDATLSGTVSNIPVPPPGGFLPGYEIELLDSDTGEQVTTLFVDPGTGLFSGGMPSGSTYHVVFRQVEFFEQLGQIGPGDGTGFAFGSRTLAADAQVNLAGPAPAGTLQVDFDFDDAIPFDREVPLQLDNLPTSVNGLFCEFDLVDLDLGVERLPLGRTNLFSESQTGIQPPDTVLLPDLDDPAFDGIRTIFRAELFEQSQGPTAFGAGGDFAERGMECDVVLTQNPNQVVVPFPVDFVTVSAPSHLGDIDPADIDDLMITYVDNIGVPSRGVTSIYIESDEVSSDLGVDGIVWQLLVPAGITQVTLPPTALPMFGDSGLYKLGLDTTELASGKFDLPTVLGGDFHANIEALEFEHDGRCESFLALFFSVGGGVLP